MLSKPSIAWMTVRRPQCQHSSCSCWNSKMVWNHCSPPRLMWSHRSRRHRLRVQQVACRVLRGRESLNACGSSCHLDVSCELHLWCYRS
jgi:hypothetical protein